MQLYHHPASSNARKTVMVARLLGLRVEPVVVDLTRGDQRAPAYLSINPNGRVPALVDGAFVLWESNAIMQYLCDTASENTLYPRDARARADINRWLFWASQHWNPPIATHNWEYVIKAFFKRGAADGAKVSEAGALLRTHAQVLDGHLENRTHVCGDVLTLADIGLAAPLMYLRSAKLPLDGFAHIARWLKTIQALEAWQTTELNA